MILEVRAHKRENGDVVINRSNGELFCVFDWWRSDKPTRRNKWIMLNCYKWRLIWEATV